MSNSADYPELQNAEKAVAAAEAQVAKAKTVATDIEAKHAAAVKHGTELADERANVALAAHTGDEKAAKRLKEIHTAIAVHGSELASLDAALRAAATKVEVARSAVAVEHQKADALKLKILSRAFVVHMRKLDQVLGDLVRGLDVVETIREQLDTLNVGPSHEQFTVLGERPILQALADTPFEGRVGRHLAPHERTSFTQLAEAWTKSHEVAVARILGEEQTKTTEAV
jgi:hypothetical protein